MRTVLLLVGKDLRRRLRSPLAMIILLLFPVLFAGMLALVFGSGGDRMPRVRLLVRNLDDGIAGQLVVSAFGSEQMADLFDVRHVGEEGRALIEQGEASALLVIPEDFTANVLDARPAVLTLLRNPAEGILPEIAEQVASVLALVLDGAARVLREPLAEMRPLLEEGTGPPTDETVSAISILFNRTIRGAGKFALPPAILLEGAFGAEEAEEDDGGGGSGSSTPAIFLFVLPGVALYSIFLVGDAGMRDVITELAQGTLKRQLSGPVGAGTIIAAKALYSIVLALICLGILSLVGATVLRGPVSVAAFVALSLAVVLAAAGAAAAIYGYARTERRGATIASVAYLAMAFIGGGFVPLDSLPASARAAAPYTPFYWGTRGYQRILGEAAGLAEVAPNVAILAGAGLVLLAAGAYALGRTVRSGASA